jgi:hypothetical protein
MDLAPGPDTTETLKSSAVELNVVETGDANVDDDSTPSRPAIHRSKSPTSDADDVSDESGEGEEWETDSLYEEALHFVRDDQLSTGEYSILTYCHSLQAPDCFVI